MTSLLPELVAHAEAASDRTAWRKAVLGCLRESVPFDDAFWSMPPSSLDASNEVRIVAEPANACWQEFFRAPDLYRIQTAMRRTERAGGVGIDVELMTSGELDRSPLYAEILRPAGVNTTMTVLPRFRGAVVSCIGLSRHGRRGRFSETDRYFMRGAVAAIGAIEMAFCHRDQIPALTASHASDPLARLSKREHQIAGYLARGLTNKEIAALVGTSFNTIRNQASRIYEKLGVEGRTLLAVQVRDANRR